MTKCLRASSRWHWSAPAASAAAAASRRGTGRLAAKVEAGLGFALTGAQRMAIAEISADLAQPRRMMRLLQGDVGSGKTLVALMAMLSRGRKRRAGRADGADRDPRPPAPGDLAPPRPPGWARDRIVDRPGKGQGARRYPCRPRLRPIADRRRDPRAAAARCRVSRPRPCRDRRAAPLWRRAAPGAHRKGPRRRHPADVGDADPAHLDDDRLWRSRRLAADRKTARPPADRHPHRPARTPRRGHRRPRAAPWRKGPKPIGSARWSTNPRMPTSPPRASVQRRSKPCCRAGSGWCTAA